MTAPDARHLRYASRPGSGGKNAVEYSNNNHEMDLVYGRRVAVKAEQWEQRLMKQLVVDVHGPVRIVRCGRVIFQLPGKSEQLSSWLPHPGIAAHARNLASFGLVRTNIAKGKVLRVERAWMVTAPPNANYIWNSRLYAEATFRALQYHHARYLLRQPS